MQRLRQQARNPRVAIPAIGLVLVLVLGAALLLRSGGDERDEAQLALQQGLQAHAEGDLETAERAYRRVLVFDPQNKFAYYNLGVISQSRGDLAEAESDYEAAIQTDPDFVPALFNLAILRAEAGADEEAVELYERIIEVDPEYAAAHLNLGFLLIELGDDARGRVELEEAVRLDPSLEDRIGPEVIAEEPTVPSPSP